MPFDINSLENHWMPFSGNRDFKTIPVWWLNQKACIAGIIKVAS